MYIPTDEQLVSISKRSTSTSSAVYIIISIVSTILFTIIRMCFKRRCKHSTKTVNNNSTVIHRTSPIVVGTLRPINDSNSTTRVQSPAIVQYPTITPAPVANDIALHNANQFNFNPPEEPPPAYTPGMAGLYLLHGIVDHHQRHKPNSGSWEQNTSTVQHTTHSSLPDGSTVEQTNSVTEITKGNKVPVMPTISASNFTIPTTKAPNHVSNTLTPAQIFGIVFGSIIGFILLLLVIFAIYSCCRNKKKQTRETNNDIELQHSNNSNPSILPLYTPQYHAHEVPSPEVPLPVYCKT
ncbi:hypothetical protein DFJ63DRAFT_334400 [Scheffersomyces coipomensis]|uniref:uncharacterized protein n=1 Tax=Scheffersomyces coipomensis TaxID=1788519 RepID=UPI00315CE2F1